MTWRPIIRWKCDPPKGGTRRAELESYFCLPAFLRAQKHDNAFLFFLGFIVFENDFLAGGDVGSEQDQCPMSVDGESLGSFFKVPV